MSGTINIASKISNDKDKRKLVRNTKEKKLIERKGRNVRFLTDLERSFPDHSCPHCFSFSLLRTPTETHHMP